MNVKCTIANTNALVAEFRNVRVESFSVHSDCELRFVWLVFSTDLHECTAVQENVVRIEGLMTVSIVVKGWEDERAAFNDDQVELWRGLNVD